jgi:DNA-binding NtrC family response regulator
LLPLLSNGILTPVSALKGNQMQRETYPVNDVPAESNACSFLGMTAIIGSTPMRQLMSVVERIARSNAAVLITGETGSGKELVARAIHHHSLRCSRPWIDVNCAALPDHLLESELFGHEKGAFSGADSMKQGLFEVAHTGTLFLDEIGELDLKMQVKLLRVLDGTPYYRLGGTRKVSVDVRIVAATNVDLREAVDKGLFRRDLYHRLDQARMEVPPLRERADDVVALARFFLNKEAPHLRFSPGALDALRSYSWPGNVRELRNAVVKAALVAEGSEISLGDLPVGIAGEVRSRIASGRTLDELEQQAIFETLSETGGRQDRAAQILGISQRTLIRKLKIYANPDARRAEAELAACAEEVI